MPPLLLQGNFIENLNIKNFTHSHWLARDRLKYMIIYFNHLILPFMHTVNLMQQFKSFTIFLLIIMQLFTYTRQVDLVAAESCQTGLVLLYNNPSINLPLQATTYFNVNFDYPFLNQPIFVIGYAGYSSLDALLNEFWDIQGVINPSYSAFNISVRLQTNTKTNMVKMSYFVVDPLIVGPNLFSIYQIVYSNTTQLVNTGSGNGPRTDIIYYSPPGSIQFNTSSIVQCFMNSLYMITNNTFEFKSQCSLYIQTNLSGQNYSNSIKFVIDASGPVLLGKLSYFIVVINTSIIKPNNLYQIYVGSLDVTASNYAQYSSLTPAIASTSTTTLSSKNLISANFVNIFTGFGTNFASVKFNFSWDFVITSSNTTVLRVENPSSFTVIHYKYLLFGKVNCTLWSVPLQQCVASCQSKQTNLVYSSICLVCQSQCKTCSTSISLCTSCQNEYFLYQSTCHNCNDNAYSTLPQKMAQCGGSTNFSNTTNNTSNNSTSNSTNNTDSSIHILTSNHQNPPYWLASLAIIPILVIITYCIYRHKIGKKKQTDDVQKVPNYGEYPSMQF